MPGKIVMLVACFMCSVPFLIIATYNKNDKRTPIPFWSGSEAKLKQELTDIKGYNGVMADAYKKYAILFLLAGAGSMIHMGIGVMLIGINCTFGIYFLYRRYKKALEKYSA